MINLGLKCGGSLKEKAQRLYDIKIDSSNLLKPKYLDGVIYNPEKSEKVNFGKV